MAIQEKEFTKAGAKGYGLKLVLTEESTSVSLNQSTVSYSFYITRGNTGFYASQPFSWNITIGGQTIAISNFKFQISTSNDPDEQLIKSGKIYVTHGTDGKKTMSFSVSTPDASWISPSYGPTAMSMTGEWELTPIPRASTITAKNANIGSETTISISRASPSFTHTISYVFGEKSGIIATKTTNTSVSWTVPTTFYAQIPKAKSGTCTITCETFSGSTWLGKETTTFTATASEALCKPSVSGAVVSIDALSKTLTGGTSKLIRYVSTARATITATAKNSATITKRTVNSQTLTSTKDFAKVETGSFVFAATDSRGYSNSATKTASIVQYVPLTLTPTVTRLTPTGDTVKVSVKGNYWTGNFGAVTNTLTLSVQYKKTGGTFGTAVAISSPTISGTSYSGSAQISGIDYQKAYVFRIVAKDKAVTLTRDVDISQGVPVFDFGKNDFRFNVPVNTKDINCSGILTLSKTTDAVGTSDSGPALIVGGTRTTAHIEIDANEILAKSDGTTPGILNLNTDGGLVVIGSGGLQLKGLSADRIIVTTTSGKLRATTNVTTTELNYLDGVTSNIQTQLNGKLSGSSAFAKLIYGGTISQNGTKTVNCGFTPQFCTYFMSSAGNAAPWVGGAINFGKNGQEFRIYTTGSAYQRFTCSRSGTNVTIKKTGSDTVTLYLYAHR